MINLIKKLFSNRKVNLSKSQIDYFQKTITDYIIDNDQIDDEVYPFIYDGDDICKDKIYCNFSATIYSYPHTETTESGEFWGHKVEKIDTLYDIYTCHIYEIIFTDTDGNKINVNENNISAISKYVTNKVVEYHNKNKMSMKIRLIDSRFSFDRGYHIDR